MEETKLFSRLFGWWADRRRVDYCSWWLSLCRQSLMIIGEYSLLSLLTQVTRHSGLAADCLLQALNFHWQINIARNILNWELHYVGAFNWIWRDVDFGRHLISDIVFLNCVFKWVIYRHSNFSVIQDKEMSWSALTALYCTERRQVLKF